MNPAGESDTTASHGFGEHPSWQPQDFDAFDDDVGHGHHFAQFAGLHQFTSLHHWWHESMGHLDHKNAGFATRKLAQTLTASHAHGQRFFDEYVFSREEGFCHHLFVQMMRQTYAHGLNQGIVQDVAVVTRRLDLSLGALLRVWFSNCSE
jgi:hypothetical protein